MNRRCFLSLSALSALSALATAAAPRLPDPLLPAAGPALPANDLLQAAIDQALGHGQPLRLPEGIVLVHQTLLVPPDHPGLRGSVAGRTVLRASPTLSGPMLRALGGSVSLADLTIEQGDRRLVVGARPRQVRGIG